MKLNPNFGLRDVCGEKVLVAEGLENIDYSKIIHLNETAAFLWENLQERDFEVEDMVDLIVKEYDVKADVAFDDCAALANQWAKANLVK